MTSIRSLPPSVLARCFSVLPPADVARCASVSRDWEEAVSRFAESWALAMTELDPLGFLDGKRLKALVARMGASWTRTMSLLTERSSCDCGVRATVLCFCDPLRGHDGRSWQPHSRCPKHCDCYAEVDAACMLSVGKKACACVCVIRANRWQYDTAAFITLESPLRGKPLSAKCIQSAMDSAPPFATIDISGAFDLERPDRLVARGAVRIRGVRRTTGGAGAGTTQVVASVGSSSSPAASSSGIPAVGHWRYLPATITLTHTHFFSDSLLMLETLGLVAHCPTEEKYLRFGEKPRGGYGDSDDDDDDDEYCNQYGPAIELSNGSYFLARGVDIYSQTGNAVNAFDHTAAYLEQCSMRTVFRSINATRRAQLAMYDCLLVGVRLGGEICAGTDTGVLRSSNAFVGVGGSLLPPEDMKQTVQPWRRNWNMKRARKRAMLY
jgi:hypothetical protein